MSEEKSVTVTQKKQLPTWTAKSNEPTKVADVKRQLLNLPPHFKSEDLSGHSFVIIALKPFKSSYDKQDHALFATCANDPEIEGGGVFTTVFGGQLVVEFLDAWIEAGMVDPLEATLTYNVGKGQNDGYYTLD